MYYSAIREYYLLCVLKKAFKILDFRFTIADLNENLKSAIRNLQFVLSINIRYHQIDHRHDRNKIAYLSTSCHMIQCTQVAKTRRPEFNSIWRCSSFANYI